MEITTIFIIFRAQLARLLILAVIQVIRWNGIDILNTEKVIIEFNSYPYVKCFFHMKAIEIIRQIMFM